MRHVRFVSLLVGGALAASVLSTTPAARAQHVVGFDDVQFWAGSGAKRAALVVDWNDGKASESLLWGFRWDGAATGEDLFRAIDAADPRLFLFVNRDPTFGDFLGGVGYDVDDDGFTPLDRDDHYLVSYADQFWSYYTFESTPFGPGGWAESNVGFAGRTLADGSWDGWSFGPFPAGPPDAPAAAAAPAPVPEPAPFALAAGAVGALVLARRRRRHTRVASAAFLASSVVAAAVAALPTFASPFATQVVSSTGLNATGLYDDPASVLGKPTTRFDGSFGGAPDLRRAKLIEGLFNYGPGGAADRLLTTVGGGQQVTVRFDHRVEDDPANPFGVDLLVFGNAFFGGTAGSGFPSEATDLNTFTLAGSLFAEPMKVSVSQDGVHFVTFDAGPYADALFPTNAYRWDRSSAQWTDEEANFTRPVNPALTLSDLAGKTAADVLDLYDGSGGGTGFDLSAVGLPWIEYVRVEGVTGFAGGEIDAFADVAPVPEPAGVALISLVGGLLCRRRRRS